MLTNRAATLPGIFLVLLTSCSSPKEAVMDELFHSYSGLRVPGAAVLVISDGKPVLERSYGMANLEEEKKVTPQTNFRLASVTKQFTAMSIMMLVERGALGVDDTLRHIFPSLPEYANDITIRHLLQHTSGLVNYEDLIPDTAEVQVLDHDILAMMEAMDSTYFDPGTTYRYSNTGYAILAMVVEKVSGEPFASFLRDNIFVPLGMDNSVAFRDGLNAVPNRAYGYTVTENEVAFTDQSITSAVLGDGGVYSSITDLYKWDQALYTDTLVQAEAIERMFTPYLESYGFGWRIDEVDGHRRIHHTGSTSGFRNVIQRFPDDRLTVIILTNRRDPDVAPLADRLAALYLR